MEEKPVGVQLRPLLSSRGLDGASLQGFFLSFFFNFFNFLNYPITWILLKKIFFKLKKKKRKKKKTQTNKQTKKPSETHLKVLGKQGFCFHLYLYESPSWSSPGLEPSYLQLQRLLTHPLPISLSSILSSAPNSSSSGPEPSTSPPHKPFLQLQCLFPSSQTAYVCPLSSHRKTSSSNKPSLSPSTELQRLYVAGLPWADVMSMYRSLFSASL